MMPPAGSTMAVVIPFTRVTGMTLLCGLMATSARAFGLMSPSSATSTEPGTELISARLTWQPASNRPG